jgi:hypothetical protein
MSEVTQATVDGLIAEARALAPSDKAAALDSDIAAKGDLPLARQARFLEGVISTFEDADIAKYKPEPPRVEAPRANGSGNSNGHKAPSTNPWSAAAWNVSEQGRVVKALGEAKGAALAKSAGCVLGSIKPNPLFNN